jgi:hypothetical protein
MMMQIRQGQGCALMLYITDVLLQQGLEAGMGAEGVPEGINFEDVNGEERRSR